MGDCLQPAAKSSHCSNRQQQGSELAGRVHDWLNDSKLSAHLPTAVTAARATRYLLAGPPAQPTAQEGPRRQQIRCRRATSSHFSASCRRPLRKSAVSRCWSDTRCVAQEEAEAKIAEAKKAAAKAQKGGKEGKEKKEKKEKGAGKDAKAKGKGKPKKAKPQTTKDPTVRAQIASAFALASARACQGQVAESKEYGREGPGKDAKARGKGKPKKAKPQTNKDPTVRAGHICSLCLPVGTEEAGDSKDPRGKAETKAKQRLSHRPARVMKCRCCRQLMLCAVQRDPSTTNASSADACCQDPAMLVVMPSHKSTPQYRHATDLGQARLTTCCA